MLRLSGQQNSTSTARDSFLSIMTDARASGQGDLGVATSADTFSQFWNAAKYIFSTKKFEIGLTQVFPSRNEITDFKQLNFTFYNKLDTHSAYALSLRNYGYTFSEFITGAFTPTHEVAIEGSYSLRLSNQFSMSVGGRFISLKGKLPLLDLFNGRPAPSLYGIDVSGYYYGNEKAYKNFNGRFRAGFSFSNLRGRSLIDNKDIEIYAPSLLKAGFGFDFIFDQDQMLAVTSEYKMLLDSYVENNQGEPLNYGLEGSVVAIGFEFVYREKITLRTGYSKGIERATDTFATLGAGFKGRYANVDLAFIIGLADEENQVRDKLRLSIGIDLDEVF